METLIYVFATTHYTETSLIMHIDFLSDFEIMHSSVHHSGHHLLTHDLTSTIPYSYNMTSHTKRSNTTRTDE